MSTYDDLRDLRDALDSIVHGALPRWSKPTTQVGAEAQRAAIDMYERFVRALLTEGASKAATDAAKKSEDQHRTHAEALTAQCEAVERERGALKVRVERMMESMSMACEEPPAGCECAGCMYSREKGGDA
jgi:hypothetical protein